jgi:HK97 family phage major capsid protein
MTLSDLQYKRNNALQQAVDILKKDKSAEARARAAAFSAEADALDQQIKLEQRLAESRREEERAGRPPRPKPDSFGGDRVQHEKRAFTEWLRTGRVSQENREYLQFAETRDLGVGAIAGNITGGNVLVPTGFDPQLHAAQKSYGALVGAVRQFKTDGGGPIKVALADDTEQSLTVIGEATAVSENDPNLAGLTSYTDELTTGLVKISNSLLTDSAFDVDNFIQSIFGQRYYRGLAKFITLGNGSNIAPITAGATLGATSASPTAIALGDLISVYAALDPSYIEQSSWVMSSTTRASLMGLTDNYGHPLLQTDLSGQPFNALFGRPIVISQFSDPIAATKTPILFGDLSSYTLRTVGGLQVARLTERFAELNETAFIGYARAGGYNTSQTASPAIVSLKMHS